MVVVVEHSKLSPHLVFVRRGRSFVGYIGEKGAIGREDLTNAAENADVIQLGDECFWYSSVLAMRVRNGLERFKRGVIKGLWRIYDGIGLPGAGLGVGKIAEGVSGNPFYIGRGGVAAETLRLQAGEVLLTKESVFGKTEPGPRIK